MVCTLSRTPSDTRAFLKQLQKPSCPHGDEALRNNINHTLKMVGNLGSHPSVIRFMKVIYELNKPQSKYTLIWDVSKVLDYLKTLTPAEKLSLKELLLKILMLILLATGQQEQLISLLSRHTPADQTAQQHLKQKLNLPPTRSWDPHPHQGEREASEHLRKPDTNRVL